jgi:hypothetical protein
LKIGGPKLQLSLFFLSSDRRTTQTGRFFFGFHPVYVFFPGSLAERFCVSTGLDAGPVPGSTGPTGWSGPVLTTLQKRVQGWFSKQNRVHEFKKYETQ